MPREKRILGLDLGVASIGWAYLTIGKDENGEIIGNILGANSRIFPAAVEGHGKNLKPKKRTARISAAAIGGNSSVAIELLAAMDGVEIQNIKATLEYTAGDKSKAVRLLGLGRKTLYRKLEQYEAINRDKPAS